LQMVIQQQTLSGQVGTSTVVYPASWVQIEEEGAGFAAADLNGSGPFGARVSLREVDQKALLPALIGPEGTLRDAATNWSLQRGKDLVGYRVLDIVETRVQGREAYNVESVYLLDSTRGAATNTMPALMHTVDTLVAGGDKYYILTFAADASRFDSQSGLRERLLNDWRIP
jgi:hypothetical protein